VCGGGVRVFGIRHCGRGGVSERWFRVRFRVRVFSKRHCGTLRMIQRAEEESRGFSRARARALILSSSKTSTQLITNLQRQTCEKPWA
jgi:hypothetical protein